MLASFTFPFLLIPSHLSSVALCPRNFAPFYDIYDFQIKCLMLLWVALHVPYDNLQSMDTYRKVFARLQISYDFFFFAHLNVPHHQGKASLLYNTFHQKGNSKCFTRW